MRSIHLKSKYVCVGMRIHYTLARLENEVYVFVRDANVKATCSRLDPKSCTLRSDSPSSYLLEDRPPHVHTNHQRLPNSHIIHPPTPVRSTPPLRSTTSSVPWGTALLTF
jgi:hypothetical protein